MNPRQRLADGEAAAPDPDDPSLLRLVLPALPRRGGSRTWRIGGVPAAAPDPVLTQALRAAHALIDHDRTGLPILHTAPATAYQRRLVKLAFLSPALQRAIMTGRQPPGLTLKRLLKHPLPLDWARQEALFGLTGE